MAARRAPKKVGEAQQFLDAMFGQVSDDLYFYLWTYPDKTSHWFLPSQATDAVAAATADRDTYVGVALSPHDLGPHARCPAEQTAGIVALWADVDYADEVHRKSNLPPNPTEAQALLDELGLATSMLVHSGHGLQAWWLLDEPWLFKNANDRTQAAELASRWLATLRARAMAHGWTIDATHDLSRVMRLPGTMNCKTDPHVPCRFISAHVERRYGRDDIAEACIDEAEWAAVASSSASYVVGQLELRRDAAVDQSVIELLGETDPRFARTWDRRRADFADQSQSSYDLALATFGADIGWSDQQIADLVIAHRRKHSQDMDKAMRLDYLQRTIAKARDDTSRQSALDDLDALGDRLMRAEAIGSLTAAGHARNELLTELSSVFGIQITRMVKLLSDPPEYRIETTVGSVHVGPSSRVWNQATVGQAIADATSHVVPTFKGQKWATIRQQMFRAFEAVDTGMESTDSGLAFSLLTGYLRSVRAMPSLTDAAETESPYVDDAGSLYVFGPRFNQWVNQSGGEHMSHRRMGVVLRAMGARTRRGGTPVPTKGGGHVNRSVWNVGDAADFAVTMGDESPQEGVQ